MNIIFGIFVIAAALYIRFEDKPKSTDAKIIFALIMFSGVIMIFGSLDFSTLEKGILSVVSMAAQSVMLAGYYAQAVVDNRASKNLRQKREKAPARSKKPKERQISLKMPHDSRFLKNKNNFLCAVSNNC